MGGADRDIDSDCPFGKMSKSGRERLTKIKSVNLRHLHQFLEYKKEPYDWWKSVHQTLLYRVSQNSRISNSERGREGPSGARKILRKKSALPEEDISTLILFNA
jgi:hypothetical protein